MIVFPKKKLHMQKYFEK